MNIPTARPPVPQSVLDRLDSDELAKLHLVIDTLGATAVGEFVPNEPEPTTLAALPDDEPSVIEGADEVLAEPTPGAPEVLVPLDFARLLADGIPETDYLEFPYIVRGARHWVFGPAESAKTLYFQHLAAKLTREGRIVAFISAENPLSTDLDRMLRLRPNFERLRFFHMPALDLNDKDDFLKLADASAGADLVVIDTLSALWSGDENSNREIVALDREVLVPLVRLTGVAIAVIHHTGHPQAFISRNGASAGRGGSAMGQKADIVLVFTSVGPHEFTIDHGKNRTPGGHKEPKRRFKVVDTGDGWLDIEALGKEVDPRVAEGVEDAVRLIVAAVDGLGSRALRAAMGELGYGGSTFDRVVDKLKQDDPPRVRQVDGTVIGADGKRRKGRPWVS